MNTYYTPEELGKYRQAGKILAEVRGQTAKRIVVGASILETAVFAENLTRDLGGQPAFPCNLSLNEDAAHYTPGTDDTAVFGEDMVKLDIGVHVDGYIADSATTVDLSDHPELVDASRTALESAIGMIHAGIDTREIGVAIEEAIGEFGYRPISNLTGHGLAQYQAHTSPSIPNVHIRTGTLLYDGQVVAIEPFATEGEGGLDAKISEVFSRADSITVLDVNEKVELVKVVENPAKDYKFGTGPIMVKTLVDLGAEVAVGARFGVGASSLLKDKGIRIVTVKAGTKVKDAIGAVKG